MLLTFRHVIYLYVGDHIQTTSDALQKGIMLHYNTLLKREIFFMIYEVSNTILYDEIV